MSSLRPYWVTVTGFGATAPETWRAVRDGGSAVWPLDLDAPVPDLPHSRTACLVDLERGERST